MKTVTFDSSITLDSPIGPITLKSLGEAVVQVNLQGFDKPAAETLATRPNSTQSPKSEPSPVLVRAAKQVGDFFAGKSKTLDFAVEPAGTEFQRAVWSEIGKVGFGEVISYAEIARRIGRPTSVRAVGGAVGSNPVPLVIGCHRILGASRNITGYSGGDGLPTKRWLLAFEGIGFRDIPEARRDAETPIKLE
jgi:methylated-DNA-[protein]-cysteine S-methyltransferase